MTFRLWCIGLLVVALTGCDKETVVVPWTPTDQLDTTTFRSVSVFVNEAPLSGHIDVASGEELTVRCEVVFATPPKPDDLERLRLWPFIEASFQSGDTSQEWLGLTALLYQVSTNQTDYVFSNKVTVPHGAGATLWEFASLTVEPVQLAEGTVAFKTKSRKPFLRAVVTWK